MTENLKRNPYKPVTSKKKKKKTKKKQEFSKWIIVQESILVWITTIAFIILAFMSVNRDFIGELSWLGALCTALWVAYGTSTAFYYSKAKAENTSKGIVYEMALRESEEALG